MGVLRHFTTDLEPVEVLEDPAALIVVTHRDGLPTPLRPLSAYGTAGTLLFLGVREVADQPIPAIIRRMQKAVISNER